MPAFAPFRKPAPTVAADAALIRAHDGSMSLANGCMCCSLVGGFASAIGEIAARAGAFDHIVIEASGVADPAKIAQYGQMYGLPLDGILVVVDAEHVRERAEDRYVGDTVVRQLAQADRRSTLYKIANALGLSEEDIVMAWSR